MDFEIPEATERVRKMEQCFDALQEAAEKNPGGLRKDTSTQALLRELTWYYESGLWLQDYGLDEKGLLPENMKRGVLSQDAVYDFLSRITCLDSDV